MFDHIGIRVKDLKVSLRFYDNVLSPLGFVRCSSGDRDAGYGSPGKPALWLYASSKSDGGVHIALPARDHQSVDAFHEAGVSSGGRDNGQPGFRSDYSPTYYAAFIIDPDGNNIEAVCLGEKA
jgi:catechol 2,3-dioxygenase-like lactoylglutathione lyase family enzyme